MSELQQYYDAFRTGYWAREEAEECACGGSGWALSEVDTWHKCPIHFKGQPHPEDWGSEAAEGAPVAEVPAAPVSVPASLPAVDDDIPF